MKSKHLEMALHRKRKWVERVSQRALRYIHDKYIGRFVIAIKSFQFYTASGKVRYSGSNENKDLFISFIFLKWGSLCVMIKDNTLL